MWCSSVCHIAKVRLLVTKLKLKGVYKRPLVQVYAHTFLPYFISTTISNASASFHFTVSTMLSQAISAVAVLLPVIVVGSPLSKPLPPCSTNPVPCVCSTGSTFGNATTYALIGARADDAYSIMGDCKWRNVFLSFALVRRLIVVASL